MDDQTDRQPDDMDVTAPSDDAAMPDATADAELEVDDVTDATPADATPTDDGDDDLDFGDDADEGDADEAPEPMGEEVEDELELDE